jgi:hypothetical protein
MQSKKRVHLKWFEIIHLTNPDLIYIRNPERNKIIFVTFHLFKTYIRNPSLFFISFFILYFFFSPSHQQETTRTTTIRACIYARGEVSFAKFQFLLS